MILVDSLLRIVDRLIQLETHREKQRTGVFETVIEPSFQDLRKVHQDYIEMFRAIQKKIPPTFMREDPKYSEQLKIAAGQLREMRERFAPVRVELKALAENLQRRKLNGEMKQFADALLWYFPDGSLRDPQSPRDVRRWSSTSLSVLDHIYEELSEMSRHDLSALIDDTIATLGHAWASVCDAYQAVKLTARL